MTSFTINLGSEQFDAIRALGLQGAVLVTGEGFGYSAFDTDDIDEVLKNTSVEEILSKAPDISRILGGPVAFSFGGVTVPVHADSALPDLLREYEQRLAILPPRVDVGLVENIIGSAIATGQGDQVEALLEAAGLGEKVDIDEIRSEAGVVGALYGVDDRQPKFGAIISTDADPTDTFVEVLDLSEGTLRHVNVSVVSPDAPTFALEVTPYSTLKGLLQAHQDALTGEPTIHHQSTNLNDSLVQAAKRLAARYTVADGPQEGEPISSSPDKHRPHIPPLEARTPTVKGR